MIEYIKLRKYQKISQHDQHLWCPTPSLRGFCERDPGPSEVTPLKTSRIVHKYGGFLKYGYPKPLVFHMVFNILASCPMILGYPHDISETSICGWLCVVLINNDFMNDVIAHHCRPTDVQLSRMWNPVEGEQCCFLQEAFCTRHSAATFLDAVGVSFGQWTYNKHPKTGDVFCLNHFKE